MGIEEARRYLRAWNREEDVLEFTASSATVALAAAALEVEEARIAKSLSFKNGDQAILIVAAGDARVDNRKYRDHFGCKARMLSPEEVAERIGHKVGGVCPFGVREDVEIYLDDSLKRFTTVYPACGSSNSAIEMSCDELERITGAKAWLDVCRLPE